MSGGNRLQVGIEKLVQQPLSTSLFGLILQGTTGVVQFLGDAAPFIEQIFGSFLNDQSELLGFIG